MSDRTLIRSETETSTVWVKSGDVLGLSLGDLRAAIAASEGMADETPAMVIKLNSSFREGEHYAKELILRDERRAGR